MINPLEEGPVKYKVGADQLEGEQLRKVSLYHFMEALWCQSNHARTLLKIWGYLL